MCMPSLQLRSISSDGCSVCVVWLVLITVVHVATDSGSRHGGALCLCFCSLCWCCCCSSWLARGVSGLSQAPSISWSILENSLLSSLRLLRTQHAQNHSQHNQLQLQYVTAATLDSGFGFVASVRRVSMQRHFHPSQHHLKTTATRQEATNRTASCEEPRGHEHYTGEGIIPVSNYDIYLQPEQGVQT